MTKQHVWFLVLIGMLWLTGCMLLEPEKPRKRTFGGKFYPDIFSARDLHTAKGLDCAVCHQELDAFLQRLQKHKQQQQTGITKVESIKPVFSMTSCVDCHNSHGKKLLFFTLKNDLVQCRTCHVKIRQDVKPAFHHRDWQRTHKTAALWLPQCYYCHGRSGCLRCHRNHKPKNHNNFWRQRGHGLISAMDREKCMSCHTADYCIRCHANTPPRSHRASWAGRRQRHCLSCHAPLGDNVCALCHNSTAKHRGAPTLPHDFHQYAQACLQCHTPLRHAYNGMGCRHCHH